MPTSFDPLSLLMLLADARLPVGAHAYSSGLEPALLAGLPQSDVPRYMEARVHTVCRVDAATAIVARSAAIHAPRLDLVNELARIELAWAARCPSPSLRSAARTLGNGVARLARQLWPDDERIGALADMRGVPRPIVMGVVAATGDIDAEALARLVFYDDAQSVAAAMLKLEPFDPAVASRWVLQVCAEAEPLIADLASLTTPAAIPAAGAPQIEEWALAHSRRIRRLFSA